MFEQKILDDLDRNIRRLEDVGDFLDKLYYNPETAEVFNKGVLERLKVGADYLLDNFRLLSEKYLTLKSE